MISAYLLLQSEKPATDPGLSLILLGVIIAWCFDFAYKRRGGVRPTRSDLLRLLAAYAVLLSLTLGSMLLGVPGSVAGSLTGIGFHVILAAWQFSRWQIRKANPKP